MKSFIRLVLVLLAVAAIGFWVWTRSPRLAPPASQAPTVSNHPAVSQAPPAVVPPPSPAPVALSDAKKSDGPAPIASSVMPGSPMVRTVAKSSRPPEAVAPVAPPRSVTQPAARADIENIGLMFRDFRTRMGENPVGSNAEIMKAVMGGNAAQARLGPPDGQTLNEQGELVDRWGTPYFFHQISKNSMEIRSAGPDRIMWTRDDVIDR